MTKTIKQLWYGEVTPFYCLGTNNPELRRQEHALLDALEAFHNSLDEKAKKQFKNLQNKQDAYLRLCNEQAFCQGYALGTRITAEALTVDEPSIEDIANG